MTSSTRVLLVVQQLRRRVPGGIGVITRGLLGGLRALENDPDATAEITLYASRAGRGGDRLADLGRPVLQSKLPGPLMVRAWDRGILDVPRRFDVVHATSLAAPPARRARLVATVHDLTWRHVPDAFPPRGVRWHEAALGRVLRTASAFVVPSAEVAADLLAAGALERSLHVVPFGCDHLPPPDIAAAQNMLERLGVEGEFLLSVSTLEPRKNLVRLLDAYELARARLPDCWPLVVVGPQGWGRHLEARHGVVLAGAVEDATLAALYQRARLVAYVPLEEGYGLPPLEAMRAGTPVVASKVPSTGDAVLEVNPSSTEEIAEALVSAAMDEAVRARLVSSGRSHVAPLTWDATARRYLELWETPA
ncbi:MAG TPA: glycosyltransferase family 1 protein [Acidimicrobiales bacterium]|nr:glycosyltransferase family 1 protein [Acidimicrobiales bacterium]